MPEAIVAKRHRPIIETAIVTQAMSKKILRTYVSSYLLLQGVVCPGTRAKFVRRSVPFKSRNCLVIAVVIAIEIPCSLLKLNRHDKLEGIWPSHIRVSSEAMEKSQNLLPPTSSRFLASQLCIVALQIPKSARVIK